MRRRFPAVGIAILLAPALLAQQPASKTADTQSKPFQAQSTSSINYSGGKEGDQTVEIANVAYEVSGDSVPGRPRGSHLVLRTSTRSKWIVGDEGTESKVTVEAWPLGVDLKQKPLYALTVPGIGARTLGVGILLVDRSDGGDVSWWSVYKLGTGQHLFDTYVDVLRFTVSRADGSDRFAGLEVPPDDASDARLKEPHAVAVLAYASEDRVIREVLITCADRARAALLRSYADTTRTVTAVDRPAGREIRIAFEENYPSAPNPVVVSIPLVKDDLDVGHAQLPPGIRAILWKR